MTFPACVGTYHESSFVNAFLGFLKKQASAFCIIHSLKVKLNIYKNNTLFTKKFVVFWCVRRTGIPVTRR